MLTLAARVLRVVVAACLLFACGTAALSAAVPLWLTGIAFGLFVGALVRPEWAVLASVALAPWGALMAGVPVRATEYLGCACLAGWLLRIDRPRKPVGPVLGAAALSGTLYGALSVLSWIRLELSGAHRVGWTGVLDAIGLLPEYLVTAGRDPHTAAMLQIVFGIGLSLVVASLAVDDDAFASRMTRVVAVGALLAAAATVIAVPVRYYVTGDWNEVIRYFVLTRSRYAFHVTDVNAAGSHFMLGGMLAIGAIATGVRCRAWWGIGVLMIGGALWVCGSRAAIVAAVPLVACLLGGRRAVSLGWRWPSWSPAAVASVAAATLLLLVLAPTVVGSAAAMSGTASRSMSVREEFLLTSARMMATAPAFGVGVGTYYERSAEFMPPGLRALYGRENAHDYFMQTAAELGVAGIVALLCWLGFSLGPLWRRLRPDGGPSQALATLLALVGFLLTCVTGHPLLVIEVSVPFWALLGVSMSGRVDAAGRR